VAQSQGEFGFPPPATEPGIPGDPGQAYGPPLASARNRRPLIIGGIVAAVLIIAVVLTVVLVGGSSSPKSVAQDYLAAAKQGDLTTMQGLTCDQYKASVTKAAGLTGNNAERIGDALNNLSFEVTDVKQTGDSTAVASIKITYSGAADAPIQVPSGTSVTVPLPLVKEHGSWKVCTA
jgi:hypothetical protein